MANRIFITSDPHFGHENLCQGIRGFSAEYNDNLIINNWNRVIDKRDVCYILGDLSRESPEDLIRCIPKLNGIKKVVLGNHDDCSCIKTLIDLGVKVYPSLRLKRFYLSHIPIHPNEFDTYRYIANIHGHIHKATDDSSIGNYHPIEDLGSRYFNVNCEYHNYTPILFDDIIKLYENDKNSSSECSDQKA